MCLERVQDFIFLYKMEINEVMGTYLAKHFVERSLQIVSYGLLWQLIIDIMLGNFNNSNITYLYMHVMISG